MSVRSLNKVQIIGNLTRDPELRYTPNGAAVCTFGIATNRSYTPSDSSEAVEETEFHNIVAWTKLAELCSQLLHKGDKVFIEGRLHYNEWDDPQTNTKRSRTEIVARDMILLASKSSGRTPRSSAPSPKVSPVNTESKGQSAESKATQSPAGNGAEEVKEGEVPF